MGDGVTITIGPHQHVWSPSTGCCVHCEIPRTVFAPLDAPPAPPRVLVDLEDLEWLLGYAKLSFRHLELLGDPAEYLARLAQVAAKAGIDGYEVDI